LVLKAISKDGKLLKHVSEKLKGDRDVVLMAVSSYGEALKYASEQLQNDKELLLLLEKDSEKSLRVNLKWYKERMAVLESYREKEVMDVVSNNGEYLYYT
jgi:hypothetical protein